MHGEFLAQESQKLIMAIVTGTDEIKHNFTVHGAMETTIVLTTIC